MKKIIKFNIFLKNQSKYMKKKDLNLNFHFSVMVTTIDLVLIMKVNEHSVALFLNNYQFHVDWRYIFDTALTNRHLLISMNQQLNCYLDYNLGSTFFLILPLLVFFFLPLLFFYILLLVFFFLPLLVFFYILLHVLFDLLLLSL